MAYCLSCIGHPKNHLRSYVEVEKTNHHPTWAEDAEPARWYSKAKANAKANVAKIKAMHDNITRAIPSEGCSLAP